MLGETEAMQVNSETKAHNSSAAGEHQVEIQVVEDAVRQLPPHAVKELFSIGVCIRCIFRLFGICGHIYSCSSLLPSSLCAVLGEQTDLDKHTVGNGEDSDSPLPSKESELEPIYCSICLGILQFVYCNDKGTLMNKDSSNGLATSIVELVKQEGYQIDNFSLEVSIPPLILENEHAVWLYMKRKYSAECWFQEKLLSRRISAKDALKYSIVNSLEKLLDVKSCMSSFPIRLTYTHTKTSKMVQNFVERNQSCKRKRQGTDGTLDILNGSVVPGTDCTDAFTTAMDSSIERYFDGLHDQEPSEHFKFPPEKVNEPCRLSILCHRTPIYFCGRYLKYSRNVSQSRWIIDDERMGEASVEEILGNTILPMSRGDHYKFHAAGKDVGFRSAFLGRDTKCTPRAI